MNRLKNIVVAFALIFSIGLHWPILQSLAWLNMIVIYSQEDGFEQALVKTFDGKHPCKLCHFVDAGKKVEKKEAKQLSLKKLDLISETAQLNLFAPEISIPLPELCARARLVFYSPSTPPPDLS